MNDLRRVCLNAGFAALFAALAACSNGTAATDPVSTLRSVRVAAVQVASLGDSLHATGLLAPKDQARLSFKTGGYVETLRVEEGARVKSGQLLAELKQTEIGATLEQARQAAEKARRDLKRGEALYADGVATLEQLQDLSTAERIAGAALRGAQFNADHARIFAPGDGVVLQKLVEAHELVQAGQPVLSFGAAGRGWVVRLGLADRDRVRIHLDNEARVEFDAWPGRIFRGRIANIAAAADPMTGTFTVEVKLDPGGADFAQGLVAKVEMEPNDALTVPVLPVQALIEANGSEAGVFVLDPDRRHVHRVTVRLGRMQGGQVEVLAGVTPGTEVVTDGAAFLENGVKVRVVT